MAKSYYNYQPSQAAAGVLCGLYGISFLVSLYQWVRYRAWVWIVMVIAIGMETVGYAARTISAGDPTARTVFIVQFCLIILSPVLMAGVIYVLFSRIVFHVVPAPARRTRLLWVPARFITPIFVGFDVIALFLQLIGAVIVAGTQVTDKDALTKLNKGKDIALAGVSAQIGAFGLFTIVAARFQFTSRQFTGDFKNRIRHTSGDKKVTVDGSSRPINPNWKSMLFVINASCLLILIRSVYREIEFAEGKTGTVQMHEYFFYVLDALPILVVVALYNVFHPGAYLPFLGFRLPKSERLVGGQAHRIGSSDAEAIAMR